MSSPEPPSSPEHQAHDQEEGPQHPEAIQVIERSILVEANEMSNRLFPLATDLAAEMAQFNHDIESVTSAAMAEKEALDRENAR